MTDTNWQLNFMGLNSFLCAFCRGIQKFVAEDLFHLLEADEQYREQLAVGVSFFEIYGGRCQVLICCCRYSGHHKILFF